MIIPEEIRRDMLKKMGGGKFDLTPAKMFSVVSTLLGAAPTEDWKVLARQLNDGAAPDYSESPLVQRHLARQLAVILFAAEQLGELWENTDPATAMDLLRDMVSKR